jgi:hypothetical protein
VRGVATYSMARQLHEVWIAGDQVNHKPLRPGPKTLTSLSLAFTVVADGRATLQSVFVKSFH